MQKNNEIMTVKEAAEFLRVTDYQVRIWLRDGVIKGYKFGTHSKDKNPGIQWRIRRADVEAFLYGNGN